MVGVREESAQLTSLFLYRELMMSFIMRLTSAWNMCFSDFSRISLICAAFKPSNWIASSSLGGGTTRNHLHNHRRSSTKEYHVCHSPSLEDAQGKSTSHVCNTFDTNTGPYAVPQQAECEGFKRELRNANTGVHHVGHATLLPLKGFVGQLSQREGVHIYLLQH